MAPTFYHCSPVPVAEHGGKQGLGGRRPPWALSMSLLLVAVGLTVALIHFARKAHGEACAGSPPPERVCRNVTHHLERRLTWAQEALLGAEAQAATCNQTALGLEDALKLEKARSRRVEELQGEIDALTQKLREAEAEAERLRRERETPGGRSDAASAGSSCGPGPWTAALLLLGLGALRA